MKTEYYLFVSTNGAKAVPFFTVRSEIVATQMIDLLKLRFPDDPVTFEYRQNDLSRLERILWDEALSTMDYRMQLTRIDLLECYDDEFSAQHAIDTVYQAGQPERYSQAAQNYLCSVDPEERLRQQDLEEDLLSMCESLLKVEPAPSKKAARAVEPAACSESATQSGSADAPDQGLNTKPPYVPPDIINLQIDDFVPIDWIWPKELRHTIRQAVKPDRKKKKVRSDSERKPGTLLVHVGDCLIYANAKFGENSENAKRPAICAQNPQGRAETRKVEDGK